MSADGIRRIVALSDGVLLAGGEDVSPEKGGAAQGSGGAQTFDPARDELELSVVRCAREARKPILAICRGMQLLNVAYGGRLIADIQEANPNALNHTNWAVTSSEKPPTPSALGTLHHTVTIEPSSRLCAIFGETQLEVNSFHHQALDPTCIGAGLQVTAYAPDGTVEAVEGVDATHFVSAVQWHPEMLACFGVQRWKLLFENFVAACRASAR
jgi:putative glutamine amidotransferase